MSLETLMNTLPASGRIDWIGVRGARRGALVMPAEIELDPASGIVGDHYGGRTGKRHLTLVQSEHAPVVAALTGRAHDDREAIFERLRRNLAVSGLNLLALAKRRFYLGEVLVEGTGLAHPCSRMEEAFGAGGYNAVRGHGGITARVLSPGRIRLGDAVRIATDIDETPHRG